MGLRDRVTANLFASSDSFLTREGSEHTYSRGATSATVNLYRADLQPVVVNDSSGQLTEIILASFRGLTTDLARFDTPREGDRITDGTLTYEVRPVVDKCYYTIGGMTHIHAKRIKT